MKTRISRRTWRELAIRNQQKNKAADEGSVLLLVIGLCLVLLLVASTVVGISAVYLERHRLQALADQSATAAAKRVEGIGGSSEEDALAVLNSASVTRSVETFIGESGATTDFSNLSINPNTGVSGANTAVVVLSATAHPPLVSLVVPQGFDIEVTGRARAQTTQE